MYKRVGLGALAALAVACPPAQAKTVDVKAEGNAVTGGLKFDPAQITVALGDEVRWTDIDNVAPHTATEDHSLWNLGGTYGEIPGVSPPGFGPRMSVQRPMEAGTHKYFCVVHPMQMHGTISVAPTASVTKKTRTVKKRVGHRIKRVKKTTYTLNAVWDLNTPANGQGFDVERQNAAGTWQPWLSGTTQASGSFAVKKGAIWSVRVRLRQLNSQTAATDFSPEATVTVK